MISLTYTRDFQIKLLVNLISDAKWFGEVCGSIHLSDFDMVGCRLVFEVARSYYTKFGALPPAGVMQIEVERGVLNPMGTYETAVPPQEHESLAYVMRAVMKCSPSDIAIDYYRHELKGYLSHVRMSQLQAASDSMSSPEDQIANIVKLNDDLVKLGGGDSITFMDAMDKLDESQTTNSMRVGTGLHTIDNMINGGLKNGQIGLLVASSGVGKTTGMINFAVNAAIKAVPSLMITLENPGAMIMSRFQSIMANVDIKWLSQPVASWPQDARDRIAYVNSPEFKFRGYMSCVDRSTKTQRVSDMDAIIGRWVETLAAKPDYDDSKCKIVYIDWLEKLDPTGTPGINKNTAPDVIWQKVLEYIGEIARRHGVQAWTATQTTRGAIGKEIIEAVMIAHSVHALDPLDLAIGLAPINAATTPGVDVVVNQRDDDAAEQPPCDRMMNASFLKAREAPVAGKVRSFYQGKTLRFWPNKGTAMKALELAEAGRLDELYGTMELRPTAPANKNTAKAY